MPLTLRAVTQKLLSKLWDTVPMTSPLQLVEGGELLL